MSINDSVLRVGNFTSSGIVALTKVIDKGPKKGEFAQAALTYIEEANMKRRLCRPLEAKCYAKPLLWGNLLEKICFDKLGMEYTLCSQETLQHPRIPYWTGSPDGIKHDAGQTVIDEKCPYTLKSFCQLVQPLYDGLQGIEAINKVRDTCNEGDTYYWQLVSNSVLTDSKFAELIIYMPYKSEIEEIRQSVEGNGDYYWLYNALPHELPYVKDGGYFKNINIIRFEVPASDKNFLIEQVIKAGKLLINV